MTLPWACWRRPLWRPSGPSPLPGSTVPPPPTRWPWSGVWKAKSFTFLGWGRRKVAMKVSNRLKNHYSQQPCFPFKKSRQKIKSTSLHKVGGLLAWRTGECQKQNFDCAQVMLETQKVERIITLFRLIVCPTPSHWGPIRGSGKKLGWRYDASNSYFTVNITLLLGWQRWRHRGGLLPGRLERSQVHVPPGRGAPVQPGSNSEEK